MPSKINQFITTAIDLPVGWIRVSNHTARFLIDDHISITAQQEISRSGTVSLSLSLNDKSPVFSALLNKPADFGRESHLTQRYPGLLRSADMGHVHGIFIADMVVRRITGLSKTPIALPANPAEAGYELRHRHEATAGRGAFETHTPANPKAGDMTLFLSATDMDLDYQPRRTTSWFNMLRLPLAPFPEVAEDHPLRPVFESCSRLHLDQGTVLSLVRDITKLISRGDRPKMVPKPATPATNKKAQAA
jgi:hypothetical protein